MKTTAHMQALEKRIHQLKIQLQSLGEMRPGSLSRQYNICGKAGCRCKDPHQPRRHGPYFKLSYVHAGKFTSQFIRPTQVRTVRLQLANYKKFRRWTAQWIHLALELAKLKLKISVE